MKNLSFLVLLTCVLIFCVSCKQKMTCDNPEGVSLIESNVKSHLIEAWALKLAAEDYTDWVTYTFWGDMSYKYKSYLSEKLAEIKRFEGKYYEQAVQQFTYDEIEIVNIIAESYDETTDKCGCYATVNLTNSNSKNEITYTLVRNTNGNVTGYYYYRSKIMLDEKTNATDFIREYEEKN